MKRVGTSIGGLQRTANRMNAVGGTLSRNLTLPIIGVGVAAAKMASDFQSSTERLRTQAGASQAQVEKLRAGILHMAGALGTTPAQLSSGMYHVVSSMNAVLPPSQRVSGELTVLRDAAKLAKVGGSDLEETTYALASAMNALHAPVSQAAKVTGQLNAIVGAGDMTMGDLIDSFRSGVVPSARQAGLSLQSLGAPMAVMGDMGIRGALAGTRLRMAIALLASPSGAAAKVLDTLGLSAKQATSTSAAMATALSAAGLKTTQLGADLKKPNGMAVALRDLNDHLRASGLTATGAAAVMTKAFGGGRMGTAITLLAQNTGRLQTKFDQIGAKAKSFGADWTATTHTTAFKWQQMVATMESTGVKLGNQVLPVILPVLQNVASGISQIGGAFNKLSGPTKTMIVQVLLVTAALGPVLKLSAALITTMRGLGTVLKYVVWKPLVAGAQGALWIFRELRAGTLLLRVQLAALAVQEKASAAWSAIQAGASAVAGVFRELRDGTMLLRGQLVLLWLQEKAGAAWSTLTGLFRSQGAAAAAESVEVNGLAASMERLTVAQREAAASGEAGSIAAGGLAGGMLGRLGGLARLGAIGAGAYGIYKGVQGVQTGGGGGLASMLGGVPKNKYLAPSQAGTLGGAVESGLSSIPILGTGLFSLTASSDKTTVALQRLQGGLRGITSPAQLSGAQLQNLRQQAERILRMPDLTAKLRRELRQTVQTLNPTTAAFDRATAQWTNTFAGFDATAGSMSRQFVRQLHQDSRAIASNWTRGTKQWTNQVVALTAASWAQIETMSRNGVKGVGRDIQALMAMLMQTVPGLKKAFGSAVNSAAGTINHAMKGFTGLFNWSGKATAAGGSSAVHAAASHLTVTPPSPPRKRGPAVHEYWDPFTNSFKLMTSADHSALRDRWIGQHGSTPSSGPSRASGSSISGGSSSTASRRAASRAAGGSAAASTFQPPAQSSAMQIQFQNLANELQQAQNANNTQAQNAILSRQIKLDRRAIGLDTRRLTSINRLLRGQISVARRQKLLQDKLSILQDIGTLRGDVGSAMSQLQSGNTGGSGQFDLTPGGATVAAPTIYDVRHSLKPGRDLAIHERRPAEGKREHHHHHNHVTIKVDVHDRSQVGAVADAIDRATGSQLHARMRSAGVRGT